MVLLRFAPSPTGPLHLGGLRMALYNFLFARKHGGKWIMRVEDTDSSRFVPGSVEGMRRALDWAGLEYDYGPGRDGPHGPYFQSERLDLYKSYANKLLDNGNAYRCFCAPDRLNEMRERLARSGSNASYDKTCLHLSDDEVMRRVRSGEKFVVRINDSHPPRRSPPTDLVFGPLKDGHASLATDPVLLKSDQFPTYHLASVVDDHEMGITHVLRGEEWLPSFALHLDLYAHLGLEPPKFAHLPVLLNANGTKMSKRNGDVQVIDYIRRGWEPAALLNWLALAGWGVRHHLRENNTDVSPHDAPDSTHVMTLQEMIDEFDISAMTQRSSILDPAKLEYINKRHLVRTWSTPEGLEALAQGLHEPLKEKYPANRWTTIEDIKSVILLLESRLTNMQDLPVLAPWFFVEPDFSAPEAQAMVKKITPEQRQHVFRASTAALLPLVNSWATADLVGALTKQRDKERISSKVFMTVVRHALTGMKDGPPVADIMRHLGAERTLARLQPDQSSHTSQRP